MKEETARALTLAACALQAYALAKSFKREVIDPYRPAHAAADNDLKAAVEQTLNTYPPKDRERIKAKHGEIVQAVLDTLKEKTGGDMTLREAYAVLQMVQYTIEAEAMSATRTQTVADVHL